MKLIQNASKYKKNCDYGVAGYFKNIKTDKETGEILNIEDTLLLDDERITEEEL